MSYFYKTFVLELDYINLTKIFNQKVKFSFKTYCLRNRLKFNLHKLRLESSFENVLIITFNIHAINVFISNFISDNSIKKFLIVYFQLISYKRFMFF